MIRNLLVFAFAVLPVPAVANLILNGSFESPVMPANQFCTVGGLPACPSPLDIWLGAYTVGNGGNDFTPPFPLPDGNQYLILQGPTSANPISQSIDLPSAGNYLLTWFEAGRPLGIQAFGGDQPYEIRVDGVAVGSFASTTGTPWASRSHSFAATAGAHTFSIVGLATTDQTAFLDNFVLEAQPDSLVPEPATLLLLGIGLAAIAGLRRL